MMHMLRALTLTLLLAVTGCGYHLIGHGGGSGAVPADVDTLVLVGSGDVAEVMVAFRQRLAGERYQLVSVDELAAAAKATKGDASTQTETEGEDLHSRQAQLLIRLSSPAFVPSAYDVSGIATQYRMTLTGSLTLDRQGEAIWQSGPITEQGDVFVSGDPASVEAARERLVEDLRKAWVADALGRFRSGF